MVKKSSKKWLKVTIDINKNSMYIIYNVLIIYYIILTTKSFFFKVKKKYNPNNKKRKRVKGMQKQKLKCLQWQMTKHIILTIKINDLPSVKNKISSNKI